MGDLNHSLSMYYGRFMGVTTHMLLIMRLNRNWHFSRPGPMYWNWRCLVCDGVVSGHWRGWLGMRNR